jgi:hypothetical protein
MRKGIAACEDADTAYYWVSQEWGYCDNILCDKVGPNYWRHTLADVETVLVALLVAGVTTHARTHARTHTHTHTHTHTSICGAWLR